MDLRGALPLLVHRLQTAQVCVLLVISASLGLRVNRAQEVTSAPFRLSCYLRRLCFSCSALQERIVHLVQQIH